MNVQKENVDENDPKSASLILMIFCVILTLPSILLDSYSSFVYSDTIALISSIGSVILCVYLVKTQEDDFKLVGLCFFFSLLFFTLAEVSWTILRGTNMFLTFPTIADFLWILGYGPFLMVCIYFINLNYEYLDQKKLLIMNFTWFIALFIAISPLLYSLKDSGLDAPASVTYLVYAILSTVVILLLFLIITMLYKRETIFLYWLFITMGLLFFCINILLFTYGGVMGLMIPIKLSNSLFVFSLLLLNGGFILLLKTGMNLKQTKPAETYQITQAIVIYENGLAIGHSSSDVFGKNIDVDVVSSMLIAIHSFITQSGLSSQSRILDEIKYEDMKIVFQKGKKIFLVAVAMGEVSNEFKRKVRSTIMKIEQEYSKELDDWQGDSSELAGLEKYTFALLSPEV